MKKKTKRIIALIIILVLFLIPVKIGLKDGGTIFYQAVLYKLSFYHTMMPIEQQDGCTIEFYEATAFSIFPFYLFDLELTFE